MLLLNRHRTVLYMLHVHGGHATRLQLVKWCFLLRNETTTGRRNPPYDFLPYHHGPFSFTLYRDLQLLNSHGMIEGLDSRTWRVSEDGIREGGLLKDCIKSDVQAILERYSALTMRALLTYIYQRYPWYGTNTLTGVRSSPPTGGRFIYTIGYQGVTPDFLLNCLMKRGLQCLIDVRSNPVSRRYGFHKSTLSRLAGHVGIAYEHFPELGIPRETRGRYPSLLERDALLSHYEHHTLESEGAALGIVAGKMLQAPSTLLCQEADPYQCHRSRLAGRISKISGLAVHHLRTAKHA